MNPSAGVHIIAWSRYNEGFSACHLPPEDGDGESEAPQAFQLRTWQCPSQRERSTLAFVSVWSVDASCCLSTWVTGGLLQFGRFLCY